MKKILTFFIILGVFIFSAGNTFATTSQIICNSTSSLTITNNNTISVLRVQYTLFGITRDRFIDFKKTGGNETVIIPGLDAFWGMSRNTCPTVYNLN